MSETGVAEKWWQKPEDLRQGTSGFTSTCLKLTSLQWIFSAVRSELPVKTHVHVVRQIHYRGLISRKTRTSTHFSTALQYQIQLRCFQLFSNCFYVYRRTNRHVRREWMYVFCSFLLRICQKKLRWVWRKYYPDLRCWPGISWLRGENNETC